MVVLVWVMDAMREAPGVGLGARSGELETSGVSFRILPRTPNRMKKKVYSTPPLTREKNSEIP